jgi:hypothetical protein
MARSSLHKGWHFDRSNSRLEFYYEGTKVGHLDANGFTVTDGSTSRITNGILQNAGIHADLKTNEVKIGTVAAVASNGAGALISGEVFIAPKDCKIVSAWAMNVSASDVTKGTATTSASYRRMTLVANTAAAGTGTHIVASLNATASAASWGTRAFTIVASTVPAGGVVRISHLTVGAETGDGTDMAARTIIAAYEYV